jgi:hypothetical protein
MEEKLMIDFYVWRIKSGKTTLEEVPEKFAQKVKEKLTESN